MPAKSKPRQKEQPKKPAPKPAPPAKAEEPKPPAPLARSAEERLLLRFAVLEDAMRRGAQATRAEIDQLRASSGDLARRVGDVEKRLTG